MPFLYSRFAVAALLLAAPRLGLAQAVAPTQTAPAPRFYVGLAAFHSNFQLVSSGHPGNTGLQVPVQLTAGYQLRPRLALELGAAYSGMTSVYSFERYYDNGSAALAYEQFNNAVTRRAANFSALARYALMRQPSRLQVEALGGLTLVHSSFYTRGSSSNDPSGNPQNTYSFASRSLTNHLLLTAGLGVRYRLSPHLALNFDVATNRNLNHPAVYNGFTGMAALGVRYQFGQR